MEQVLEILRKIGFNEYNALVSIINFFIVYAILAKYLFPGLQQKIEERKAKIDQIAEKEKSLDAYIAKKQGEAKKTVEEAHVKADQIVSTAISEAENQQKLVVKETKDKITKLQKEHEIQLENQKKEMIKEAHEDVIDLSVSISKKVINQHMSPEVNEKMLKELVSNIEISEE